MENTQTNHQLLAIRLRWLNWLSKPIVAIWNFIVESVSYVWTIIKLAWAGMKESINYRYWLIGTIGGSISVFLVLLFYFIGIQVREPTFFFNWGSFINSTNSLDICRNSKLNPI